MTARADMMDYASDLLNGNAIWLIEHNRLNEAATLMRIVRDLNNVSDDDFDDLDSAFEAMGFGANETLSSMLTRLHLEDIRPEMSAIDYIRELVGIHHAAAMLASMDDGEPVVN
jgi:hypothetical protein